LLYEDFWCGYIVAQKFIEFQTEDGLTIEQTESIICLDLASKEKTMHKLWKAHPWAVSMDAVLILVCWVTIGYIYHAQNSWANRLEVTGASTIVTRTYIGRNMSTAATAITGSTVHQDYSTFIRHSRNAFETYLVKEGSQEAISYDTIYALLPNGHTYSTSLTLPRPDGYTEQSREITSDSIVIHWRLDPFHFPGWEATILGALFAGTLIGLTVGAVKA